MINVPVLIPAYNPDRALIDLVKRLLDKKFPHIIVVNDGSHEASSYVFETLETIEHCAVLTHSTNQGKGCALKTGFDYFYDNFPESPGIVTADADGQHTPADILKVADTLIANPDCLIIGTRTFSGSVPFRSMFGNTLTRYVFFLFVGKKIRDTQSGLRGIPKKYIPDFLKLKGDRYEFEINVLISTKSKSIDIIEPEITTVYIDDNRSSHFNPVVDSIRIYLLLIKFAVSSCMAALIDFIVFVLCFRISNNILVSISIARIISCHVNFLYNKQWVFDSKSHFTVSLIKYYALVILIGSLSYTFIKYAQLYLNMNVIVSKIIIEILLFSMSFTIQRDYIFYKKTE
ncbi:MAG: hypothetical protein A2161_00345 [Candidatus Schekmanbacteria bacterium RBG_13_48_7]|uniref:GtrA-like protein domain-containing protein n=1 Tax=Candidatus Schekmanbacteria bacterium RBG_13_48_7 TaxID=1817878 RepID=A0A1F7S7J6_9BACT|nr:MAG: hypothetical protein A2161_00345 [Candidatus Schekmanbacteria bacterium RBG_13_48_7]